MRIKPVLLSCVAALGLAACSGTDLERGIIGAAGGAFIADRTGGDPVVGAAIGGTAGVVCDDVTPQVCN
ncbi:hypothetical protein [Cognatishimia sp. F0-27]|uniref:hypothetical protein n=1 Tax=Cognatishimia sp. F0-27 TaxID=2816855 RepID=UPI001D0C59F5|nr:hypothetical protein [Cognatishimia sp. F0-27]MCC1492540.1 hypothetical protein [Cognatishimia sp. F0-27]